MLPPIKVVLETSKIEKKGDVTNSHSLEVESIEEEDIMNMDIEKARKELINMKKKYREMLSLRVTEPEDLLEKFTKNSESRLDGKNKTTKTTNNKQQTTNNKQQTTKKKKEKGKEKRKRKRKRKKEKKRRRRERKVKKEETINERLTFFNSSFFSKV